MHMIAKRALFTKDALRLFSPCWSDSKADEPSDFEHSKENVLGTIDWSLEIGITYTSYMIAPCIAANSVSKRSAVYFLSLPLFPNAKGIKLRLTRSEYIASV